MSKFLILEHVRKICYEYAKSHLTYDEPIPSFDTRFPGKLEGCLQAPQQSHEGMLFYKTLPEQAAVLFYEMIKIHPFLNGNKRIAMVSLMTFLSLNGKWIHTSWRTLYDIAITVASSDPRNREGVLKLLKEFIKNNLIDSK